MTRHRSLFLKVGGTTDSLYKNLGAGVLAVFVYVVPVLPIVAGIGRQICGDFRYLQHGGTDMIIHPDSVGLRRRKR